MMGLHGHNITKNVKIIYNDIRIKIIIIIYG